ncbi:MAG: hypothetical protein H6657_27415 [Ardenticatenaceae bacterium]|nr:hypothetical protein [Ardenticatenaceae bacterium]
MNEFQRFLEGLSKGPCDERVIIFRHEALRPLNFAKGYAKLLELEAKSDTGLPEDAPQLFEKLLSSLDEIGQLLDALVGRYETE